MVLIVGISIQHFINLDDVCIALVSLILVTRAVEAKNKALGFPFLEMAYLVGHALHLGLGVFQLISQLLELRRNILFGQSRHDDSLMPKTFAKSAG
jgi:hypothetical protein